jgi:hypothetical protein
MIMLNTRAVITASYQVDRDPAIIHLKSSIEKSIGNGARLRHQRRWRVSELDFTCTPRLTDSSS